jgi:sigma-B regulation protein RsbU (phosphoserine phosphatase)
MLKRKQAQIERDEQLYQLTTLVAGDFSLQQVLDKLTEAAVKIVGVKACTIRLLDEQAGEMKMRSSYGLSEKYRNKGPVSKDDIVIKQAFEGKAVVLDDMRVDGRVKYKQATKDEGLVSQLTVAMEFRGKAIGVLRLYSPKSKRFTEEDINLARSVASQCAVAITNAKLYAEALEGSRIAEQMRLAGVIQRRMIPQDAPKIHGLDIAAKFIPCFDVGGDFYDFIKIDENSLIIVIADVMGKGIPAAIMTSSFRGAVRAYTDCKNCKLAIGQIIDKLNKMACHECRVGEFVSLFYAIVDTAKMKVTYCNCGHEPGLILRNGNFVELNIGGLVLGVDKDAEYKIGEIDIEASDRLLLYTDGLTDAFNYDGQIWGRQMLLDVVGAMMCGGAGEIVNNILGYRRRFVGLARQVDDTSIIVVSANRSGPDN